MSRSVLLALCGVGGLFVGVFVNQLIIRAPGKRSFLPPWTRCTNCNRRGSALSLMPVAGPLMMDGQCDGCGASIGRWQLLVEAANAALWMLAAARYGPSLTLLAVLPFFSVLLALSVIDLLTYRLPDRLNLPLLLGAIPLVIVVSLAHHDLQSLKWAAIGGFGYWGLLAVMWFVYPSGMGYGDVKLARVLGMYLGWTHFILPIYGLMFAGIGGSIAGIGMVIVTRDRKRGFPFGPWMAGGCVLAMLLSPQLTRGV